MHPIFKTGLLLLAMRVATLAARHLVQPDDGWLSRLGLFVPAALFHAGTIFVIVAGLLCFVRLVPRWRRTVAVVSCAALTVLLLAGEADLAVSSITGAPLTPTVFRTYRGFGVVRSNEFLEPLRANWAIASAGLAVLLVALAWIGRSILAEGWRRDPLPSAGRIGILLAAGISMMGAAAVTPWPTAPPPIEVAFTREYLGYDAVRIHGSEREAIDRLRRHVGLPADATWMSDEYPLAYRPARRARKAPHELPDIVVVMVESLRASELAFVTGDPHSVTPRLDALAAESVVLPTYISNGFPSAPSVLSFHTAAWPHRRKEIITDFSNKRFDSIPLRLRSLGYNTVYVGADPHFDHQDVWLSRWYGTALDLVARGESSSDRNIMARAIAELSKHDAAPGGQPLFAFISTHSTHYPFRLPSDSPEQPVPASDGLRAQYRQTLRYTDAQIGWLLAELEARPRRDRTITIIVGDHAFYTDLRRTSGLPENDNEWTAAIIAGPSGLIGSPRRIVTATSHVDIMPTILALVGDGRPTAALGSNLLGKSRTDARTALSLRPGGWRLDRDGYSTMIDARTPNVAVRRPAFPELVKPPESFSGPTLDAIEFSDLIDSWSYLIEHDRVWNDALLER